MFLLGRTDGPTKTMIQILAITTITIVCRTMGGIWNDIAKKL
jgi:hypothetical protein